MFCSVNGEVLSLNPQRRNSHHPHTGFFSSDLCHPEVSDTPNSLGPGVPPMLSPIQTALLRLVRCHKFVNRRIVQDELYPDASDGAQARELLRGASINGWVRRVEIKRNEYVVATAPLYVPTESGCALLATVTGDMSLILDRAPSTRNPQDFSHYLNVTRFNIEKRRGFATQSAATLLRLVLEHDYLNPDEPDASKKRTLFTVVGKGKRDGNVICNPDFATLVSVNGYVRAFLWEYECGSDTPSRVAAKKTPGFFLLHKQSLHKQLFPDAKDMRVVAVCPNAAWRETLRRSLRGKDGSELWLCVSRDDVRRDGAFLREPVFWTVNEGDPRPLIKPQTPPPSPVGVVEGGDKGGDETGNGSA